MNKYLVKVSETELWTRYYEVEANSEDEAKKTIKEWNPYFIRDCADSEDYEDTLDREIIEIELFNHEN